MKTIQPLLVPKFFLTAAITYTAVVTYLCLTSSKSMHGIANGLDKIGHFSFHFGMVLCWFLYFKSQKKSIPTCLLLRNAFLLSLVYGILIELAQKYLTTTRTADVWDVVANSVGGLIAVLILLLFNKQAITLKK